MKEDLLPKNIEELFKESLHNHPLGPFIGQCTSINRLPWAIEFKCGCCCKKASNVRIVGVSRGLLLLAPFDLSGITVELFGEEGVINAETARFVLIPWDNVCSLEVMVIPTPLG